MSIPLETYCDAIARRRAAAFASSPGPREELISPYTDTQGNIIYTPAQLDMRRKIEILQYNRTPISAADINTYIARFSGIKRVTSEIACNGDINAVTTSYGTNVPGPEVTYILDPNAPLYMYKKAEIPTNS